MICPTTDGCVLPLSTPSARRVINTLAYVPPTWPFAMRPGFTQTVDPTSYSHTYDRSVRIFLAGNNSESIYVGRRSKRYHLLSNLLPCYGRWNEERESLQKIPRLLFTLTVYAVLETEIFCNRYLKVNNLTIR